jgi:hypothetical protein
MAFSAENLESNQCILYERETVSVGQTLAIMRGDAININAQAAEGYMNAKSDISLKMLKQGEQQTTTKSSF